MTFMYFLAKEVQVHLPHLALGVHPASDFFYALSAICLIQLGQELPEGLQKYLEKSPACDWECCQIA